MLTPSEVDELYQELLNRVSERFDLLAIHHGEHMSCASGCHSCCHPDLTISEVEARLITTFLQQDEVLKRRVLALEKANPHQGQRCTFLNELGRCEIYDVRPVVCRSFGVPLIQVEDPSAGEATLSVCELNFTTESGEMKLGELSPAEWLDTQLTDTALAQLSYALSLSLRGGRPLERTSLKPSALLREAQ